jgi:hypothetical protein
MKNKIIGIFVCMLMIATALPVSGTLIESEQKNIVLNQNNKNGADRRMGIGFITNRTFLGDGTISFNCVFFLYVKYVDQRHGIYLYHSHESLEVPTGGIRYIGRHFAFFFDNW